MEGVEDGLKYRGLRRCIVLEVPNTVLVDRMTEFFVAPVTNSLTVFAVPKTRSNAS